MRPLVVSRAAAFIAGLALLTFSACDSTSDNPDVSFKITLEGSGSGSVKSQSITLGLDVDCRLTDGEVSGTCEDTFVAPETNGFIRVQATPAVAMNFDWGPPCEQSQGALCDVRFETDAPPEINVRASFNPKTDRIVMMPPNAVITIPGAEGAVLVTARAVDEDRDDVAGVTYSFEVDRPDVVSMTPQSANSIMVTALANGQAIVTATAQGVSGSTAIDVRLSN